MCFKNDLVSAKNNHPLYYVVLPFTVFYRRLWFLTARYQNIIFKVFREQQNTSYTTVNSFYVCYVLKCYASFLRFSQHRKYICMVLIFPFFFTVGGRWIAGISRCLTSEAKNLQKFVEKTEKIALTIRKPGRAVYEWMYSWIRLYVAVYGCM